MANPSFDETVAIDSVAPKFEDTTGPSFDDTVDMPSYANGTSPETPVNKSPVGLTDRMLMSLGNEAGNVKFLKSKFEDVRKTDSGDLAVKDAGIWHRVEPRMGQEANAWDVTKNIISKAPQLTGLGMQMSGAALGTAAGAVAGPAGMVGGAGLGAAAGETIRTSLGRLAGTYEADDVQQMKDIGWETALAAGGQKVALGVEPAIGMLKQSFKKISEVTSNTGKEYLSTLLGHLTEAGRWETRRALDGAGSVIGKTERAIAATGNAPVAESIKFAEGQQARLVESLASDTKEALQRNYGQAVKDIVVAAPDNFSANVKNIFNQTKQQLVDAGYGFADKAGNLRVFTDAQVAERLGTTAAEVPKIIGPETRQAMTNAANIINRYSQYPTLEGKMGAKKLVDLKKALGESFDEFFQDSVPKAIQSKIIEVKQGLETGIAQQFANHGDDLGQRYINMNQAYSNNVSAVREFNKLVEKNPDQVVKKLASESSVNNQLQGQTRAIAELLPDGAKRINDVLDWQAAKKFIDFVPKTSGGNSAGTVLKTASTLTGQNVPRVVGKEIAYGTRFLDFMKSLPPDALKRFLSDDANIAGAIRPIEQAYTGEESEAEQLLKSAGVK